LAAEDGLVLLGWICERNPGMPDLVPSESDLQDAMILAVDGGAMGFVPKR